MQFKSKSVEIHESKRFDAKGVETFRPSPVVREPKSKVTRARTEADNETGDFYNVYMDDKGLLVLSAEDLASERYDQTEQAVAEFFGWTSDDLANEDAIEKAINGSGLPLLCGDRIKDQHRTGTTSKLINIARDWLTSEENFDLMPQYFAAKKTGKQNEWLLAAYANRQR